MNVFFSLQDFNPKSKTIITIGTFDGVHVGHRKIIDKIIQNCKNENLESTILTFFPHPRMVLQNNSDIKLLNTIDEKIQLAEELQPTLHCRQVWLDQHATQHFISAGHCLGWTVS